MTAIDGERHFRIDPCLDGYETFFDHRWAKKTLDLAEGTAIDKAAIDLVASWKAIANAHRMPWALMKLIDSFWEGFASKQSIPRKYIGAICKKLGKRFPGLSESKRLLFRRDMQRIAKSIVLTESQRAAAFSSRDLWEALIADPEGKGFALGIWGTQRLCYPALYHFYEDFFRQVMAVRMGKPNYRIRGHEKLVDDATKCLGAKVVAYCLTDQEVELVRLVRNAFAHKGGRMTEQLHELHKRKPLPIELERDTLQIMAGDTAKVFNLLKDRAYKLVEVAIT